MPECQPSKYIVINTRKKNSSSNKDCISCGIGLSESMTTDCLGASDDWLTTPIVGAAPTVQIIPQLVLCDSEIDEAISIVITASLRLRVRSHSTTTTGDDPRDHPRRPMSLIVGMPSKDKIDAIFPIQIPDTPVVCDPGSREMGNDDVPLSSGLLQAGLQHVQASIPK